MPRPRARPRPTVVRGRTAASGWAEPTHLAVIAVLVAAVLFASLFPDESASVPEASPAFALTRPDPSTPTSQASAPSAPTAPPTPANLAAASPAPTEAPAPASTTPSRVDATVAGTELAALHACPAPSCEVRAELPLGAPVAVTGASAKGFTPVATVNGDGYIRDLYLKPVAGPVPFLEGGDLGCERVALIFNIGIGEEPDTGILDTLAAEEVPATMFVMGWWAERRPPILERMVRDGYPIGSHGYAAEELPTLADDAVREDLRRATAAIEQATGEPLARLFTPYAAAIDDRVRAIVAEEGYLPVGWEVAAADYGPDATEEAVYDRIMSNVHDGAIVELHLDGPASAESTGRALPRVIDDLRAQGYRFVTIPEMANPCP